MSHAKPALCSHLQPATIHLTHAGRAINLTIGNNFQQLWLASLLDHELNDSLSRVSAAVQSLALGMAKQWRPWLTSLWEEHGISIVSVLLVALYPFYVDNILQSSLDMWKLLVLRHAAVISKDPIFPAPFEVRSRFGISWKVFRISKDSIYEQSSQSRSKSIFRRKTLICR